MASTKPLGSIGSVASSSAVALYQGNHDSILCQHVEQKMLTLSEHLSSPPGCSGVRVLWSLVFWVVFWRSLFVLSFFLWSLYCLSFFDIRLLITLLWHLQTFHTIYAIFYFIEFAYCMHLSPSHFTVELFWNLSLSTRGGNYITQVFTVARKKWWYHSKRDVLLQWPIHPCLFCVKLSRLLVRLIQILATCI